MNTITVRDALSADEVTRSLIRRRSASFALEIEKLLECDYRCGRAKVFFYEYRVLEVRRARAILIERIVQAKCVQAREMIFLVVLVGASEVSIETLSWININCGLEHHCSVVFCWAVEEVVQLLETLSLLSNSSLATLGQYTAPANTSSPLSVLIEALMQSPQILTRTDIVRAFNRCKSVSDLLLCSVDTFVDIPGFGPKKTKKVHELFNTPFVFDMVPKPSLLEGVPVDGKIPDAVRHALERIRNMEDDEDMELNMEL
ncbi:unnamed protein product [Phytomonas sp. Hart1]|nr:unnamed protein product [Phytomonas sp. Hart1]|eukprot:CCW66287.1 unnamed protein product [Phytomonas sp. isolate Hart1]